MRPHRATPATGRQAAPRRRRRRTRTRLAGAVLVVGLGALAACTAAAPEPQPDPAPAITAPDGVLVHLFQWPWADVATECRDVLGPAGVAGVQISPPQEHVELPDAGYPWWQDYQPVSYRVDSRRGDRTAFAAMITQCHAAGVKVYADAVINHMSAQAAGVGSAGTAFTGYDYPGLYTAADFHSCHTDIVDYGDRTQVQTCELVGLADLATEQPHVQETIAAYLDDLLSLGVDGFRIDAAKHIAADDLRAILARLDAPAAGWAEVLYSPTEPIQPSEYRDFIATLEPRYGTTVSAAFRGPSLTALEDLGAQTDSPFTDLLPPTGTVVYVDSHDSQRGSSTLTYRDGDLYLLAEQFMLAWPYGTPLVMSGYAFTDYDAGPPAGDDGVTLPVQCTGAAPVEAATTAGFVCEHRRPEITSMVAFRAAVGDAPATRWWAEDDQLGFARDGRGYFALNRAGEPVTRTVTTGLPAGAYRDLLSGRTVEIGRDGRVDLTIPATGAVALVPATNQ